MSERNDKSGGPGAPLDTSRPVTISPQEPWVKLTVRNKLIDFIIDMGATYSVPNTNLPRKVTGVTGQLQK